MSVAVSDDLNVIFRQALSRVCSPVSVVTSLFEDRPHGTTVSAFASLSMTPPMILVSLDRQSDLLANVRRCGAFGINVLASDQGALATTFARKGDDKFDGVAWTNDGGLPRLDGAVGWLRCSV